MKYAGIDLHSNNSVVTVIDETDKVVAQKRLPNDLSRIIDYLEPHKAETAGVVVESTYNWYWLVDGLQEAGYTVHLATQVRRTLPKNPIQVTEITGKTGRFSDFFVVARFYLT